MATTAQKAILRRCVVVLIAMSQVAMLHQLSRGGELARVLLQSACIDLQENSIQPDGPLAGAMPDSHLVVSIGDHYCGYLCVIQFETLFESYFFMPGLVIDAP